MKKLLALLLIAPMLALALPAAAHGNCSADAVTPQKVSGQNQVKYAGSVQCGESHAIADLTIRLYSRPGGSTGTDWTQIDSKAFQQGPGRIFIGNDTYFSFNCNKDYRSSIVSFVSPGSHLGNDSSSVLQNTC